MSTTDPGTSEAGTTPDTTYEEYTVGDTKLALIGEADEPHAWIQSDVTLDVEP